MVEGISTINAITQEDTRKVENLNFPEAIECVAGNVKKMASANLSINIIC